VKIHNTIQYRLAKKTQMPTYNVGDSPAFKPSTIDSNTDGNNRSKTYYAYLIITLVSCHSQLYYLVSGFKAK